MTPAVILLYLAGPHLIQLLYSKAFLNSFLILKIALFSVILKSVIFPLGYIVLAKGDKKLFFKQALLSDSLNLFFSIVLYKYYGLTGLGFAYVFNYVIYGVYIYYVTNKYYHFTLFNDCKKLIVLNAILGISAIISILVFELFYANILIAILLIISVTYSAKELNERINIKEVLLKLINKFRRK